MISSFQTSTQPAQNVPKEEEGILNYFLDVRTALSQLKKNRTQYLNSGEVQKTYQEVLTKVRELDAIRKKNHDAVATNVPTLIHNADLHNRVDSVLDDVFQLLSLCFLTVGLKNSAPATYASLSTVESLLQHLEEAKIYTHHDLKPIKDRLNEISKIVEESCAQTNAIQDALENDEEQAIKDIDAERTRNKLEQNLLLKAKLKHCVDSYNEVESKLEDIDPTLTSVMEKLFQIRRGLLSLVASSRNMDSQISEEDLDTSSRTSSQSNIANPLGNELGSEQKKNAISHKLVREKFEVLRNDLKNLEAHRDEDGKFKSLETDKVAENGQLVLNGLLDDCNDLVSDLSHQIETGNGLKLSMDPSLQPVYERLLEIKTTLENLMITRRWTLRETDLFSYQKKLNEIDNLRVNGRFPTETADSRGQSILLYLLRRCYAIIYKLLESSEPVSEALQPIHNQLSTVRRCLLELKRMGGVNNERELYPYQMKLASLDNLRQDGIFYDSDGNIPEGQGILNALLAGCFDIIHELKVETEERGEEDEEEDDDDDDDEEQQ
ncbi:Cub1p KNAG_0L00940 [Huiozyma naganishii CBS 8797]|uniref:Uncharacterized protein n=1 Tax=Huiozyma naganishii (strain ATCC MYA-139 / BCRC 22969 / CBS 8797 / KCTC 17520 / NBRC 10181 / NCYC 3082 / Yp74L-3) TaxID=1071383 RepID=J7SB39_HUIN7|nr:hypothetical protein KNAG_0L00940 [Kazachstania naganishii CBS 8797]CCK72716.1 hypothetical protein KNAG_0L00940 [Kazachstania naganishii CBS 8797]